MKSKSFLIIASKTDLFFDFQKTLDILRGIATSKRRALGIAASHFGNSASPGDKGANLFGVVTDLNPMIINDDRPAEDRRVLADEIDELGNRHVIEVDVVLRNDLAARGNDIVGAVFRFGNNLHQVIARKFFAENILLFVRNILVVEPFFDFAATRATRGIIDFDHSAVIVARAVFLAGYLFIIFLLFPIFRIPWSIFRLPFPFLIEPSSLFLFSEAQACFIMNRPKNEASSLAFLPMLFGLYGAKINCDRR